jgi:RNA polymerase sigma-70 factor (ECF subfamily)
MDPTTRYLIQRSANGDLAAMDELLQAHRPRLRRMVSLRLDPRLAARVDPSDIVQDALVEAHQKLPEYLQAPPLPFYPWLRQIAWEQLIRQIRVHLDAQRRSVLREQAIEAVLPEASSDLLVRSLVDQMPQPDSEVARREELSRMKQALHELTEEHREVLVLRFLEGLSLDETAAVLHTTEAAIRGRQFRAIQRLKELLE